MTVETLRILQRFEALCREGETAVLASVIRVEGSTYRRPGARALIPARGEVVGLIGGGCLEADLLRRAAELPGQGVAEVVHYDNSSPDDIVWGLGLGCAGKVEVLLEPVCRANPGPLDAVEECVSRRRPAVLATVIRSEEANALGARLVFDGTGIRPQGAWPPDADPEMAAKRVLISGKPEYLETANRCILVERLQVPVRLLVIGAGVDAMPLVELASGVGWMVDVVDHRQALAQEARFPGARSVKRLGVEDVAAALQLDGRSAAVLMTHNYLKDLEILADLLASPAAYVGVLGPKARLEMLLRDLRGEGLEPTSEQLARLRGPVGLDLGAESPEEIALAIVAEIKAHFARRDPIRLADKVGAIH